MYHNLCHKKCHNVRHEISRKRCREQRRKQHKQAGFALPLSIFIVVILALLIAAFSRVQQSAGDVSVLQLNQQRAFFAAESALQFSLNLLIPPAGEVARSCAQAPFYQLDFDAFYNAQERNGSEGYRQCQVIVNCSQINIDGEAYYTLISQGRCGQGLHQATREIEMRVH